MKVLFISRLYPNEYDKKNGLVMHRQVLELKKKGVDVRVISPIPVVPKLIKNLRSKWLEYYLLPDEGHYEGVKIYYPRYIDLPFGINDHNSYKSIIKSANKLLDKVYREFPFDLVHTHMGYPDNFLGISIKSKYNVPLVTTVRSTDMDITFKKAKLAKLLELSLSSSDLIISPSPQLAKKLQSYFGLESIHIGNGIYPHTLVNKIKNEEDVKFLNKFEDKKIILSISNLIESKGIQYNISAVSDLVADFPDIIYLIIGDGPYRIKLMDQVKKLNLESNVKFLGSLEHRRAMFFLSQCDIFSMPSWRETFGLVYLEAMYYRKPVIMCENQGMHGAVKNNINGVIVPAHSPKSIVKSITDILKNAEQAMKMTERGYELVSKNYTWPIIGEKLYELYKKVI